MRKLVIIGGALLVLFVLGLWVANSRGFLPGYVQIRTYTDDASGLLEGTRVRLDGIPIGYLDQQLLTGSLDPRRKVEFQMKVRAPYLERIPVDSVVRVVADNLLGDKSIDIVRGHSSEHVEAGTELASALAVDPNKMMAQAGNEVQEFQKDVDRVNQLLSGVDAGRGTLGKLTKNWADQYGTLPDQAQNLIDSYRHAHGTLDKLLVDNTEFQNQVDTTSKRIDDIIAGFQAGQGTAGKLPSVRQDLDRTMNEIDQLKTAINQRTASARQLQQKIDDLTARFYDLSRKIDAGQGTIGQLLTNPQFSSALDGATSDFERLAKDMRANPKKFFTFRLALF